MPKEGKTSGDAWCSRRHVLPSKHHVPSGDAWCSRRQVLPSKHHVPPFMALPPRIRDRRMPGPVAQPVPSIGRRLGAAAEVKPRRHAHTSTRRHWTVRDGRGSGKGAGKSLIARRDTPGGQCRERTGCGWCVSFSSKKIKMRVSTPWRQRSPNAFLFIFL